MINDQIIIDGVDVSGCENYAHSCNEYLDGSCSGHNCYYKQLQRLKAENEAMRRAIKEWEHTAVELRGELDNLQEKNLHILRLAKMSADTSEYCMRELEEQNEELKIQNESLRNHISDLLQQLNELKEAKNG